MTDDPGTRPGTRIQPKPSSPQLTGMIDDPFDDAPEDFDLDPDRLAACEYWRCGELFERRSVNHRFCRKACRATRP